MTPVNKGTLNHHYNYHQQYYRNPYFLVTIFFPLTNFVDVDVERKFPLPP